MRTAVLLLSSLMLMVALCATSVSAVCGDGVVEPGEQCDDMNAVETDGCLSNCTLDTTLCTPVLLSFFDHFDAVSYTNSDGNADWATTSTWVEGPGMNGPGAGVVMVIAPASSLTFFEAGAPPVAGASAMRLVPFASTFGLTAAEYDRATVVFDIKSASTIAYFLTVCDAACTTIYYRQCFFDGGSPVMCPAPVGVELPPAPAAPGPVAVPLFPLPPGDLTVKVEIAPEIPALSHMIGVTMLEVDSVLVEYTSTLSGPLCCITNLDCELLTNNTCNVGKCVNNVCEYVVLSTGGSYIDNFSGGASYSKSDGTIDWSPFPWVEAGDDGSPSSGDATVTGGQWVVQPPHSSDIELTRKVPTSNTTVDGAMLFVQGMVDSAGDGQFELLISQDGVTFTNLVCQHSLVFGPQCFGSTAATIIADIPINLAINITDYIGPHMTVKLRSRGPCNLFFPCVEITMVEVMLNVTQCTDGDPCTMGDMCVSGSCVGMPLLCDDNNGCTLNDQCVNGSCVFQPPIAAPCDVCGVHLNETTASPIVVTTTLDVIDPLDGLISMREAVSIANGRGGNQEIVAPAGTYPITLVGDDDQNCVGDFDLL